MSKLARSHDREPKKECPCAKCKINRDWGSRLETPQLCDRQQLEEWKKNGEDHLKALKKPSRFIKVDKW